MPFLSSLEEGQVASQPQKELDALGDGRTTSLWSGLRIGYSEKPDSPISFQQHRFLVLLQCVRCNVGHSPLATRNSS